MRKTFITNNEIIICEFNPNKRGLKRIQKNIMNKSKQLITYTGSILSKNYPDYFKVDSNNISRTIVTKLIRSYKDISFTYIVLPDIVVIIEEFRRGNFNNIDSLIKFNFKYPEVVSEIIRNLNIRVIYKDNYNLVEEISKLSDIIYDNNKKLMKLKK